MSKEHKREKLIESFLKLLPDSPGLLWDQAVSKERQGHEMLITGDRPGAIAFYEDGIEKKRNILDLFKEDPKEYDLKRLLLAQSEYHLAMVYRANFQFEKSKETLQSVINTVQEIKVKEYQTEVHLLLQDVYHMMADLVPWITNWGGDLAYLDETYV